MRTLISVFFCLCCFAGFAQKLPDYGLNKVRIIQSDKIIIAEINPVSSNPKAKSNLSYYWYSANMIHVTQGGFSGKLLDGQYNEFYPDKNLKEQGMMKKGLKHGVWKTWNDDGTLAGFTYWENGLQLPGEKPSFWKKINVFKKKHASVPADTTEKAH